MSAGPMASVGSSPSPCTCATSPDLYQHEATILDGAPGRRRARPLGVPPGGGGQVSDTGWLDHAAGTVDVTGVDQRRRRRLARARRRRPGARRPRRAAGRPRAAVAGGASCTPTPTSSTPSSTRASRAPSSPVRRSTTTARAHGLRPVRGRQRRAARPRRRGQRRDSTAALRCAASTSTPAMRQRLAGLVRSLSVAPPPTPDGTLRVIDIDGVDRQACGGTHLANPAQSRPFRITKVESKGQRNRRHPLMLDLVASLAASWSPRLPVSPAYPLPLRRLACLPITSTRPQRPPSCGSNSSPPITTSARRSLPARPPGRRWHR